MQYLTRLVLERRSQAAGSVFPRPSISEKDQRYNNKNISALRRSGISSNISLAKRMQKCAEDGDDDENRRCGLTCCKFCARQWQKETLPGVLRRLHGEDVRFVTILLPAYSSEPLHNISPQSVIQAVRMRFRRSGLRNLKAFGFLEVQIQKKDGDKPLRHMVHLHMICTGVEEADFFEFRRKLNREARDAGVTVPFEVVRLPSDVDVASVTHYFTKMLVAGKFRTKNQALRGDPLLGLLNWLSEPPDRFVFRTSHFRRRN